MAHRDAPGRLGRRRRRRPSPAAVVAWVLLLAGLGTLGSVGHQLVGTSVAAREGFAEQAGQARGAWAAARRAPASEPRSVLPSGVAGLLRVPRFGAAYEVPILAGTDEQTLTRGVGHYPGTAAFGAVGNAAVAGHRVTHGQPFARLLELDPGDQILVETRAAVFTYALRVAPRDLTVSDDDTWVLRPTADRPPGAPGRRLLTLTTCQDVFRTPDRSVGVAELVAVERR